MALTPGKAKKMLDDGTVHGRGLTDKQKRYFGAIAGGATPMKKINGGWLDKYAMGGSLPGASGMMYGRSNTPPPLYTQSEMKAQNGDEFTLVPEDGIKLDEVVITGKSKKRKEKDKRRKELFENMPDYLRYGDDDRVLSLEQQQQLKDLGITDVASYNEYFGTDYSKENAGNEFYYLNSYKPEREELISSIHGATNTAAKNIALVASLIPSPISGASLLSKTPQAYRALAGPLGQAYKYTANSPVGRAAFKYIGEPFKRFTNYKPGGGPFSIGNYADAASVGYGGYNIAPDVKELYNNPSWSAAGNVGLDALSLTPLLNKRFTDAVLPNKVKNITKYYTNPLGDAFKIGNNNPNIPTFLTRGQTPPNPLRGNPRSDANNFMQSWTSPDNPSFVSRFDDQIRKPFSGGTMNENYLRVQTRELNVLQQQLDDFVERTGSNILPKAKALQKSITELEKNINGFWKMQYPQLARNNMKAIQAGEFPTTYSSADLGPGVGGSYFPPTANWPLNTWKYLFPNHPNKMGIGNNSVVKLREVPPGATEAVKTKARTNEMLTGIHETLGHASNAGGAALTKQTNELIRGALKPNPKIKDGTSEWVQKFFKDPKATFKDWTKYLQDETEMVARVMELRRQYIPKEFWGTSKQYQVDDKLIDRIFRDGLSGKSKVNADFFRVIDKKGLKKLMKGLYATIPMAIGADGLLEYKHGGWLDKFQEGGVIEDDRGQWAHPGKITKINSNKITMKGVDVPVLGVSDTGDKKMMQPGKDYKFDGNSVTEYPMAQAGYKIPTRQGVRLNYDDQGKVIGESSHIMKTETFDDVNWFSFPTLFQDEDGTWVDMSEQAKIDWKPVYEEAKRRGEIIDFGKDKERALKFGKGSWKTPKGQTGLKLKAATPSFPYINRVPDPSPQVDFLKDWTNSTRGQELLSNSFDGDEKDIERLTYKRINNLDNVDFSIDDHASDFLGRYNRNRHDIKLNSSLLDTSEPKLIGNQDKDVVLHELSHAQDFSPDAEFNRVTIPFSDQKLINKYRKRTIKDTKKLDAPRKVRGDIKDRVNYIGDPTETRARLNSIRYFYETSPIGKEEGMPSIFDSEVTSDMMEVMKDNQQFRELQEVYNDEEILELLNTVSDNSKSSGPSNMAYAQEGAGVNKEGVKQYKWFKNYMRSPKYVERLKKEFPDYTDKQIGQEVKSRLENVMQTRVGFLPRSSDISTGVGGVQGVYNADEYPDSIMLRPEYSASTSDVLFEPGNYLSGYNTIPLHEWSHAADDGGNRMPQSTTDLMLSKMKENSLDIPKDKYYYTRPTEYLGRMQPLRYLMEQEGLYDAGTQDFTKEDLEKAKQNKTIKNNVHFQDLMKNVNSDEDFIELMNTVASVNQKDNSRTMMAKQGRSLVTLDQLTNFTNYNTPQPGGWLDKY